MKIAIVSGHFIENIGYQEVSLARSFARLGHNVKIFTSKEISSSKSKIADKYTLNKNEYKDNEYNYEVKRLRTIFKFGSVIIVKNLLASINKFAPDIVIVIGIGKLFPFPIFLSKKFRSTYYIISVFGDNKDYYKYDNLRSAVVSVRMLIMKYTIKKIIYALSVKYSNKIITTTPETVSILMKQFNNKMKKNIENKTIFMSLGFDPEFFFYSDELRKEIRKEKKIDNEETVIITITRVVPNKGIENIIDAINAIYKEKKYKIRYLLVGLINNSYKNTIAEYIEKKECKSIISTYPFMERKALNKLLNAADIGIWLYPTISIQEAMGTGLLICIPSKISLRHLLTEKINGISFNEANLKEQLSYLIDNKTRFPSRKIVRKNNEMFNYNTIANNIVSLINTEYDT